MHIETGRCSNKIKLISDRCLGSHRDQRVNRTHMCANSGGMILNRKAENNYRTMVQNARELHA